MVPEKTMTAKWEAKRYQAKNTININSILSSVTFSVGVTRLHQTNVPQYEECGLRRRERQAIDRMYIDPLFSRIKSVNVIVTRGWFVRPEFWTSLQSMVKKLRGLEIKLFYVAMYFFVHAHVCQKSNEFYRDPSAIASIGGQLMHIVKTNNYELTSWAYSAPKAVYILSNSRYNTVDPNPNALKGDIRQRRNVSPGTLPRAVPVRVWTRGGGCL